MFALPVLSPAPAFLARPYSTVDDDEAPFYYSAFDARRTALEQLALATQQEQRRQAEAAAFLAEKRRRQRQAAIEQAVREEAERRRLEETVAYCAALIRQAQQEEEERHVLAARRRAAVAREQRRREEDQQRRRFIEARRQPQQQVDLHALFQFVLDCSPETEIVAVEQPPAEPAAVASASPAPARVSAPSSPSPTPLESPSTSSDEAASVLQRHFRRHLARREALSQLSSLATSFESRQSAFSRPPSFTFQRSPSPSSSRSPTPPLAFGAPNASFLAYEDFLVNLLSKVDAVESGGDRAIKSARKELVRKVEKELARLDAMKDRAWEEQTEQAAQNGQEEDAVVRSRTPEDTQPSATLGVPATSDVDPPSPSPTLDEPVSPAPEPTSPSPSPSPASDPTPASTPDHSLPSPTPLTAHAVSALSAATPPVSRPASPAPSDSSATSSTLSVSSGSSAVDAYISEMLRRAHKLGEEVARMEEEEEHMQIEKVEKADALSEAEPEPFEVS
ncbi:hypothetical protein JCM21900_001768 [Sporobolomyces salmonicolor]